MWPLGSLEVPHLNVPATVALPRMLLEQDAGDCDKAGAYRSSRFPLKGSFKGDIGPYYVYIYMHIYIYT